MAISLTLANNWSFNPDTGVLSGTGANVAGDASGYNASGPCSYQDGEQPSWAVSTEIHFLDNSSNGLQETISYVGGSPPPGSFQWQTSAGEVGPPMNDDIGVDHQFTIDEYTHTDRFSIVTAVWLWGRWATWKDPSWGVFDEQVVSSPYFATHAKPKLKYNNNETGPFADVIGNKFVVTPVAPQGKTINNIDWSIQNTDNNLADVYTNQVVTKQSGFQNTSFGTNGILNGASAAAITAYWGPYGGQEVVSATFHYTSGNPDNLNMSVTILVPNGSIKPVSFGTPSVTDHDNSLWISSGTDKNIDPGFFWSVNVDRNTTNGLDGNNAIVQILSTINNKTIYNTWLGNYYVREFFKNADGSNNWPLLDDMAESSSVFYGGKIGTVGNDMRDGDTPETPIYPGEFLFSGDVFARDYTLFQQTLMFQPTSGVNGAGIYVPLGIQFWSWEAVWQVSQPNKLVSSIKPHIALPYKRTTNYPSWGGLGSTYTNTQNLIYYERKL